MQKHTRYASQPPRAIVLGLGLALTLSACDTGTDAGSSAVIRMTAPAVVGSSVEQSGGLSIAGTNGTLLITDIKLIVNELELRRQSVMDCDDDSSGPGDCGSFESRYFVADVPLGSGAVTIGSDRIPEGTYTAVEFEVKDLEVDVGDADEALDAARIAAVLAQVRATYSDWPAGASMVIVGTFTPTGGVAQPFRTYFDAEVEVERLLSPPLLVDATSTGLTIDLWPDLWFKNPDGSVRNLALSNFATTGTLVEFEVEFEDGCEVEIDD